MESHLKQPAGFWIRLLAYVIDSIFILTIAFVACKILGLPTFIDLLGADTDFRPAGLGGTAALTTAISTFWHVIPESSKWQATIGKKILRLQVTDEADDRISFMQAIGRFIPKLAIIILFPIAMVAVGLTESKRGIHDFLAGTKVDRHTY